MSATTDCYDLPQYWDLAFSEDTVAEADFLEAAAAQYCSFPVRSILEPGCGGGRLVLELSRRGFEVTGWDASRNAVDYVEERLLSEGLSAELSVCDMTHTQTSAPVDLAHCFVNTFRHILTEESAVRHLRNVAKSLRPGGLYVIGMHLLPPDADEEDEEQWSVADGGTNVRIQLDVAECNRAKREEVLRFHMSVESEEFEGVRTFSSDYRMRIYQASDVLRLFESVPEFELLDVYDFWYDIDEPLTLSDELGDTVFVLRRKN